MELDGLVYADRSGRGKLRLTGPQRAWFLHQIMTQAFEDIAPGEARETAMITAHGRMVGYLEVVATEDALLAHFEPSLLESLPAAIRRYVFATQVEIEDVSAEMGLVLVAGPGWEDAGAAVAGAAVAGAIVHPTGALGIGAAYLWVPAGDVARAAGELGRAGARAAPEEELEEVRIANRVPRWGYEMDPKTIPQEAGIEERAVHFDKGCYVGQEAMAKIHFRGKVNRRVAVIQSDAELEPGEDVVAEGAPVGVVTSAAGRRGLAIVKRTVEPDAIVSVGDVRARVVG
ncbi:MAG: folate-binding protein YgfZ [Actinomycetota bacterium]